MDRAKQNNEAAVHSALLENLSDDAIASLASSVKYSTAKSVKTFIIVWTPCLLYSTLNW